MDGWMKERLKDEGLVHEQMNEWMNGRMDRRNQGYTD